MDWINSFVLAIQYIEENLLEDVSVEDVAEKVYMSPSYFQKAFSIFAGVSVSDYIKSRRLYLAALDLKNTDISVTDVAFKYRYETLESFTKAFTRFHEITPRDARSKYSSIKVFLPLTIEVNVKGGDNMNYVVDKHEELKFVGFEKEIKSDEGYIECPKMWDEFYHMLAKSSDEVKAFVKENRIAEFAICHDEGESSFKYMIGGLYKGGDVPSGFKVITLPSSLWAKFEAIGPLPGALQSLNTKIWHEWIPNNPKYNPTFTASIEWYSNGDINSVDYKCEIWMPIKEK